MGAYINPGKGTKEEFLKKYGIEIDPPKSSGTLKDYPSTHLPVALIYYGAFTVAGIAYSDRELQEFAHPDDDRPKRWFIVRIEDLLLVSNIEDYLYR